MERRDLCSNSCAGERPACIVTLIWKCQKHAWGRMSRSGLLITSALLFAVVAAGVLVWLNVLDGYRPGTGDPTATNSNPTSGDATSHESELVKLMNDVAAGSGYAATFNADDTHSWKIDDGHTLERFRFGGTGAAFARISSTVPLAPEIVHLGIAVFWPSELTNRFSGQNVEVGIVARGAPTNPAPSLTAVFATRQAGNSGWQELQLTPQFQLLRFSYQVPKVDGGYQSEPMLVLHADREGKGRGVELLGVLVRPEPQP